MVCLLSALSHNFPGVWAALGFSEKEKVLGRGGGHGQDSQHPWGQTSSLPRLPRLERGQGQQRKPRSSHSHPLVLPGIQGASPLPSAAPKAEQGAQPPSVQCSGTGSQPLVPPFRPEAWGPTHSTQRLGRPPAPVLSVHGPCGEWWQEDEEAWPCLAAQGLGQCGGVSRFGGKALN